MLEAEGIDVSTFAPEFPALARLNVGQVRALGLEVANRPLPGDSSHCQVFGVKEKHRKKLLQLAKPLRKPHDVDWD